MKRDDGTAPPKGRETGCPHPPCAQPAAVCPGPDTGVSSCASRSRPRVVWKWEWNIYLIRGPHDFMSSARIGTGHAGANKSTLSGGITLNQMLEWMVSGFQVPYCSCRITSAGNAPRLSLLMAGGMLMLSLEHYGRENGRGILACFYLYLMQTWPSSLAFTRFCAGVTGHRWGSRSCWCTVIRRYSRTGSFIMLMLDKNAF